MDLGKHIDASGRWLMANCGKFPSDMNCKLVMMAPESQREDLKAAAVEHAIKSHGHEDNKELREQLDGFFEVVTM